MLLEKLQNILLQAPKLGKEAYFRDVKNILHSVQYLCLILESFHYLYYYYYSVSY